MNQGNEHKDFGGNADERNNIQAGSNVTQDTTDYSEVSGTLNGAVTGAMIGAQFGLIGTVVGGITGGAIGNQIEEVAEEDNDTASKNQNEP